MKEIQSPKYNIPWLDLNYGKPEIGQVLKLPILSGSMFPELSPGDILSIECIPWYECEIGDIIVFKSDKGLIAHRFLFRISFLGECYFYQKGDRNRFGEFINANNVVGVVLESEDVTGNIKHFIETVKRKQFKKLARNQLKKDVIERFIYLPRILMPLRLKQLIKHVTGRK